MSNSNNNNDRYRYSSVALLPEELGAKILNGLKWPEPEKLKHWTVTPKKQFHATLSTHGPVDEDKLPKLKEIYRDVADRHPPIKGATLSLGNSFGNANEYKSGGKPNILLMHLDLKSHFLLTDYWMDLHKSIGRKFQQGRADRFMHFTLARVPKGHEQEILQFIEDNKDFVSEQFDLTPGLYSHRKSPEGQRGYCEEELTPLVG